MNRRRPVVTFFVVLLVAAVHLAWTAGQLPDVVASHFDGEGLADGTSSRASYVTLHGVLLGFMAVVFGGIAWLAPRLPDAAVNIPHKAYWLAPQRRAATMGFFRDRMFDMGAITVVFLAAVNHLTLLANRADPARLSGAFWPVLLVYLGFVTWWTVVLVRAFPAPPARD